MAADLLEPRLDQLSEEYVLVQAWKKTAAFIRYHNWYSDTLELDRAAVNRFGRLEARSRLHFQNRSPAKDRSGPGPERIDSATRVVTDSHTNNGCNDVCVHRRFPTRKRLACSRVTQPQRITTSSIV